MELSFVDEVKGHIPRSKVVRSSNFISFENLKSDWNQTWFIDTKIGLFVFSCSQMSYLSRSTIMKVQVKKWAQNVKFVSFKKNKTHVPEREVKGQLVYLQTWTALYYIVHTHLANHNYLDPCVQI